MGYKGVYILMPVKCLWHKKYLNTKGRAKERGLEFTLSLGEYKQLAEAAEILDPYCIGRANGKYQLARYGDVGGYKLGNCRFITKEQNDREALDNGCYSNMSTSRKGKTRFNDAGRSEVSEKLAKNYQVTSPSGDVYIGKHLGDFCTSKELNRSNMYRVCSGKQTHYKGWVGHYVV